MDSKIDPGQGESDLCGSNGDGRIDREREKGVRSEFAAMMGKDPSEEQKRFFSSTRQGNDLIAGVPRCF